MIVKNFEHISASSLKEAAGILSRSKEKGKVIAGGTDLLGTMKDNIHSNLPEIIIDLKTIPNMSYIRADNKTLRIGALTTIKEIAANKTIRENYRVLAEAARKVAAPQLRNMGTIAGNICQEPRCWYYRTPDDQFHCLRKGGNKCSALLGDNRYHSVFGGVRISTPSCSYNCPAHTDIPAYMAMIREGDFSEAATIILERNPMPAITGRICPHTCEADCNRKDCDEAVSIRDAERDVGDFMLDHAKEWMKAPKGRLKKSVAIVGSGPAGLSAAYYLRRAGYAVTVFERYPEAGGMLRYAIPDYRLSKDLVKRQIAAYEGMGIVFKANTNIGKKGLTLKDLRKKFQAVFLATGCWRQKTLKMENAELLTSGMDFLTRIETRNAKEVGTNVLVIGGGNVAVDVATSALKLGARKVTMACLETCETMPAFPEEIAHASKEGVNVLYSWGPHKIIEKKGKLQAMELVRCTSVFDANECFSPTFDESEKQVIEAEQIILAVGQSAELEYLEKSVWSERNLINIDNNTFATSVKGVFAGGDATYGPASVVTAIASGRDAAYSIDAFLARKTKINSPETRSLETKMDATAQQRSSRTDDATSEAQRCLNCSCIAVNASDIAPALIVLDAIVVTTKRTVRAENFFSVAVKQTTILDPDEIVKEIVIPSLPSQKSRQDYLKFRVRNAIDFPIVGLAFLLNSRNGKIKDARIAFGAVAPTPRRMKEVEDLLKGKTMDEETASSAGERAVRDANPQDKNKYKLQVMKALLKKAILGEHPHEKSF